MLMIAKAIVTVIDISVMMLMTMSMVPLPLPMIQPIGHHASFQAQRWHRLR
jgi:hypothetical protein